MAGLEPDSPYLEIDLETLGTPESTLTDVLVTPDLFELRVAAMAAHASQASPFDRLSPELRWAFLADTALVHVPRDPAPPV
jgi:N-acetyl-1-D-myo-inositol-2-amino-2-deoxy-alpha-D-glucopyranoside deacetylase